MRQKTPRDYFDLLDLIHQTTVPRTYAEIGVASGRSLSLALPGTILIGIDPAADIRHPISGRLNIFRATSDAFFAANLLGAVLQGLPVDLSFIDGLHQFEVVLRDFRNLESASSDESIILIHDCVPPSELSAERNRTTNIWTGDVWKAIVALRRHRADLVVTVVDVPPTGLAVVTGLQPGSRTLFDQYDEICHELAELGLPSDRDEIRRVVGVTKFDWPAMRRQLPIRPFRKDPVDQLVRQRTMRWPTTASLAWRMRRSLRLSALGRVIPTSSVESRWSGRGA